MMSLIKPIRDEKNYTETLARVEKLWDSDVNTVEGNELDILMILIESYEAIHYPMPPSDPVEAIKFRMGQMSLNTHPN